MAERNNRAAGQATIEFALALVGVLLPVIFSVIFTSQLLWVWHSVNEFTRQGASYASTHCWQSSAGNVLDFMRSNVPPMISQDQFQNGPVQISVTYFARDPVSGQLTPFECDGDCSTGCIPDTVTVSVTGYEYRAFVTSLGLPPVVLPDFRTSLPIESAGCDPEQAQCLP
jgi:TadE-like protein